MNVAGLSNLSLPQGVRKASPDGKLKSTDKLKEGSGKSSFASALEGTAKTTAEPASHPDAIQSPAEIKPEGGEAEIQNFAPEESIPEKVSIGGVPQDESIDASNINARSLLSEMAGPQRAMGSSPLTLTSAKTLSALPRLGVAKLASPPLAVGAEDQATALSRRVVWNDFLRKMGDLGLSAEDVLKAFGSLSEKELAQPPEKSIDKLVLALGIPVPQAALAKQCFQELMVKTKATTLAEEFNSAPKQNSLAILSQQNLAKRTMQQSLENMDRNFFNPPPPQKLNPETEQEPVEEKRERGSLLAAAGASNAALFDPSTLGKAVVAPMAPAAALPGLAVQDLAAGAAPAAPAAAQPSAINELLAQMKSATPGDKKAIDEIVRNFALRQPVNGAQALQVPTVAASALGGEKLAQTALPAGAVLGGTLFATSRSGGGQDSGGDDASDEANTGGPALGTAVAADARLNGTNQPKNDFQTQMAQVGAHPLPMAVPELLQQAQVMVREGGGDLKVTLHPDGLGELAMRVSVTDGRVNVQMITESDEAKKLIERQIGELKSGLSANHLQVESIKIDTASNLGQQLEQQSREASRQQAQANMEQFRQDNQGWRRSFFETGSINPYQSQADMPHDSRAPTLAARSKNSARRLDLVA